MRLRNIFDPYLIRRSIRFWFQRRIRGWDDSDTFDLHTTLARMIAPRLRRYAELDKGCPASLIDNMDDQDSCDAGSVKWAEIVGKMATAFELVAKDDQDPTKEDQDKIDEGLRLFAEHFQGLWW